MDEFQFQALALARAFWATSFETPVAFAGSANAVSFVIEESRRTNIQCVRDAKQRLDTWQDPALLEPRVHLRRQVDAFCDLLLRGTQTLALRSGPRTDGRSELLVLVSNHQHLEGAHGYEEFLDRNRTLGI